MESDQTQQSQTTPLSQQTPSKPPNPPRRSIQKLIFVTITIFVLILIGTGAYAFLNLRTSDKNKIVKTEKQHTTPTPKVTPNNKKNIYIDYKNSYMLEVPDITERDPTVTTGTLIPLRPEEILMQQNAFIDLSTYTTIKDLYIKSTDTGVRYNGFFTMIISNKNQQTLETFAKEYANEISYGYEYNTNIKYTPLVENVVIGENEWYKITGFSPRPINLHLTSLPNGKVLAVNKMESDEGSFTEQLEEILKSFKTFDNNRFRLTSTETASSIRNSRIILERIVDNNSDPNTTIYGFYIYDDNNKNKKLVFEQSLGPSSYWELVPSGWAENNDYYLARYSAPGGIDYLAIDTQSKNTIKGSNAVTLNDLIKKKGYSIDIVEWDKDQDLIEILRIKTVDSSFNPGPTFDLYPNTLEIKEKQL